jgi:hypothetical protein
MAAYTEIDTSQFPLVRVRFTGHDANVENFQAYLDSLEKAYSLGPSLGIIFDATHAILPKLAFQNMQAQWLRLHSEMIRTKCVGTAYVITKPVLRTMLRLIFALQEQPTPYVVSPSVASAEKWVRNKLDSVTAPK